ncbi:Uma2 family endonuclease [Salinarimonas soli]|uniref:Uma2 family endonuclease n=1 Tax=Salinarimonas soli TaxID=1638099 RepID=A0A5B2VHT8_9HYPH|nr:Uma2 family endonuclease [Salinarimonas soli]KAA2237922.1 Uma2 family endonuclease [Salinarimonas soli]
MAEPQCKLMSAEEFLAWQLDQEERYELVDGFPVPLRGMTGASNVHDVLVVNMIASLAVQLRGGPCRVATADTAIRTSIRNIRRPDVSVDCAPPDRRSQEAQAPTLVVEVLSPSNRPADRLRKIEEYKRLPTLLYILFVEPDAMRAVLLERTDEGWRDEAFEGSDAAIALPRIGATLTLRDVYEGAPPDGSV